MVPDARVREALVDGHVREMTRQEILSAMGLRIGGTCDRGIWSLAFGRLDRMTIPDKPRRQEPAFSAYGGWSAPRGGPGRLDNLARVESGGGAVPGRVRCFLSALSLGAQPGSHAVRFHSPARRTGRADFPHPALSRDHAFAHGRSLGVDPRCVKPQVPAAIRRRSARSLSTAPVFPPEPCRSRRVACRSTAL